jgi:hypothetical protein
VIEWSIDGIAIHSDPRFAETLWEVNDWKLYMRINGRIGNCEK